MLILVFFQTGFRLLKTSFKPVFGFTGLHRNLDFSPIIHDLFAGHISLFDEIFRKHSTLSKLVN